MKFSKIYQHTDGKFYVQIGSKKYMTHTASESREEALVKANMESIKFHIREARELMRGSARVLENDTGKWQDIASAVGELKDMIEETQTAHLGYNEKDPCTWY